MILSASVWLFFLIALPGLWLTHRIYYGGFRSSRSSLPLSPRSKRALVGLSVAAWIALAWFALQPLWKLNPEIYHPPAVLLAIDESPSYAALGARASASKSIEAARKHYASLGFRVHVLAFGETATRLSALRHAVDSISLPNLQAILMWSDGRFFESRDGVENPVREEAVVGFSSVPVFPVQVSASQSEIQGEDATVRLVSPGRPERGAEISISWRGTGREDTDAVAELRAGNQVMWRGKLRGALTGGQEASVGSKVTSVISLNPGLTLPIDEGVRAHPQDWKLWVRPASGAQITDKNDTVNILFIGFRRAREIFIRPLISLEERGLVDALSASDSIAVKAASPSGLQLASGDVLWIHAGRSASVLASAREAAREYPLVEYYLPEDSGPRFESRFDGDARVSWIPEGADFMPGEVLRLADLGIEQTTLKTLDPRLEGSVEALAWAEQGDKKGLLIWRARLVPESRTFSMISPPLWRRGFNATGATSPVHKMQSRWVKGVSSWVRAGGEMKPVTPEREHDPLDREWARLGNDEEMMARIAGATHGKVLHPESDEIIWPVFPSGQTRESRFRAASLAPTWPAILVIVFLLCSLWVLRKRFQID